MGENKYPLVAEPTSRSPEIEHGNIFDTLDHGADSELQRSLSTRHITMIALGSSIGMGLWPE